jgi:hypothetical protein
VSPQLCIQNQSHSPLCPAFFTGSSSQQLHLKIGFCTSWYYLLSFWLVKLKSSCSKQPLSGLNLGSESFCMPASLWAEPGWRMP